MANRNYKTARGVTVDIDAMRLINDRVIAVGNMGVNARGDQVDKDGNITKPRGELMKENYKINARLVKDTPQKRASQPNPPAASKPTFLNTETPAPVPAQTQSPLRGALASSIAAQKLQPITTETEKPVVQEAPVVTESEPETDSFAELLTTDSSTKTLKRI